MIKFLLIFSLITSGRNSFGLNVSSSECGIMSESSGLVQGGQLSNRNQFPWITNIFTKQNLAYVYAGSGSLVSHRFVLCAGNSVAYENYLENGELNPERNYLPLSRKDVKLIFGSVNYKASNDPDALIIEILQEVILHPNFKGTKPRTANIALLKIRRPIPFSDSIKPVCMWNSKDDDLSSYNNLVMYSVGHGVDESGSISFLRKHVVLIMQSEDLCKRFYRKFSSYSGFFCARGNGISTPCRYDKGLYMKIDGVWYLRGLSSMFKRFQNGTCSPNAPVLYEDIEPFLPWINSIVF